MKSLKLFFTKLLLISAGIIIFSNCSDSATDPKDDDTNVFEKPVDLNDGWIVDVPRNVSISENILENMLDGINSVTNHNLHSVLIIKDGKLVFEKNFQGYPYDRNKVGSSSSFIQFAPTTIQFMASISKSVTSVLAGIAVDKGFIKNVEDKLLDYYPEYQTELADSKKDITIHQTLSMTTGLKFDEYTYPYGDSRNDITKMFNSSDPIKAIFSNDLVTEPGTVFYYNSGSPNVIANLISKTSGHDFLDFTTSYLFEPLGINNFLWEKFYSDNYFASGGLHISVRDIAKIGFLFLNKGIWNGSQVISESWIEESTKNWSTPIGFGNTNGYGYYWWLNSHISNGKKFDYYYAAGWGEQYMMIVPSENMMAVFTSGNWNLPIRLSVFYLFEEFVLGSLE